MIIKRKMIQLSNRIYNLMEPKAFSGYVSGPLTYGSSDMKEFYEVIAEVIDSVFGPETAYVPHKHTDPVKHPNVTPEEVYRKDKEKVTTSNFVVAYVGAPSLGAGAELEMACTENIPILLLHKRGEAVSRLPRGMFSMIGIFEYNNEEEALEWLEIVLIVMKSLMPKNPRRKVNKKQLSNMKAAIESISKAFYKRNTRNE